jgi:excisionase family DNA binding protein
VTDLADRWAVSESFIYKNIQRLKIPHVKLGRVVRFYSNDVEKWLRQKTYARMIQPKGVKINEIV